jgi:enterochelin esterase-like enzyme
VWLDVGEGDDLRGSSESLMARLDGGSTHVELHVWPGQHDRAYWRQHVADYLRFYASR